MPSREELLRRDEEELSKLGYTQQLLREMGGFSNFAISFSVISILTGAVLLFGYGLKFAGPIINTAGWPIVSLFTLVVAASMAELASLYPTAGGLYFWAFRLGGRGPAFTTAWLNMVGQVTITAGIDIAAAIYLIGTATRLLGLPPDATLPVFGAVTGWSFQLFVMVLIMIPQVAINVSTCITTGSETPLSSSLISRARRWMAQAARMAAAAGPSRPPGSTWSARSRSRPESTSPPRST